MIIAMIGSHGTGKTTLCNSLITKLGSEWSVFDDYYRKTAQQLSYRTPREAILENQAISQISSAAMTGAAFGAMSEWLESIKGHGIIDTGPPSLLAYHRYWLKVRDTPISPYMLRLAKTISHKIDAFCYL
nr:AAA family ATPase [Endozoicomonas sp.]